MVGTCMYVRSLGVRPHRTQSVLDHFDPVVSTNPGPGNVLLTGFRMNKQLYILQNSSVHRCFLFR